MCLECTQIRGVVPEVESHATTCPTTTATAWPGIATIGPDLTHASYDVDVHPDTSTTATSAMGSLGVITIGSHLPIYLYVPSHVEPDGSSSIASHDRATPTSATEG